MAAALAKDHTASCPTLRGMGLSSHPAGGYDKWTQAATAAPLSDSSACDRADSWATISA